MDYYLYKINNLFLDNETNFLLTELQNAFYQTIEMHKKRIDYNYKLAIDYVNQLNSAFGGNYICTGFYQRLTHLKTYFIKYTALANSEDIFKNLEDNYLKIKNDIFKFASDKLSSINKYYFGKDIYEEDFYFVNRINLELSSIFEKINKFFNQERLSLLKAELLGYSLNEIQQYNDKKYEYLEDLYNKVYQRSDGYYDCYEDYMYQKSDFWHRVVRKKKKYIAI